MILPRLAPSKIAMTLPRTLSQWPTSVAISTFRSATLTWSRSYLSRRMLSMTKLASWRASLANLWVTHFYSLKQLRAGKQSAKLVLTLFTKSDLSTWWKFWKTNWRRAARIGLIRLRSMAVQRSTSHKCSTIYSLGTSFILRLVKIFRIKRLRSGRRPILKDCVQWCLKRYLLAKR